jgi:hypothetical protein
MSPAARCRLSYAVGQIAAIAPAHPQQAERGWRAVPLQKRFDDALQPSSGASRPIPGVIVGKPLNLALVAARPTSGLVCDPNIGVYTYKYQDDQGQRAPSGENAASLGHKLGCSNTTSGFTLENLPQAGPTATCGR